MTIDRAGRAADGIPMRTQGANELIILTALMMAVFLNFTAVLMPGPLLVDLARDLDSSVPAIGQIMAASALLWGLLAPVIGPFSDRYGRKPMLALGLVTTGAGCLVSGLAWGYDSLLAFRLLTGVGGAAVGPTILSVVADYFTPGRRGRALGWLVSANGAVLVVGVPVAALLAGIAGWRVAFAAVGCCTALLGIVVALAFPPARAREAGALRYRARVATALQSRTTRVLLTSNLLQMAAITAVGTYLPAFLMLSYRLKVEQVAPLLSLAAVGVIVGGFLGGRLSDGRRTRTNMCIVANALGGVLAVPLLLLAPAVWASSGLAALMHMSFNVVRPVYTAIISRVSPEARGTIMGFNATSNQLGSAMGAALGGAVLFATDRYGYVGVTCLALALASAGFYLLLAQNPAPAEVTPNPQAIKRS